MFPDEVSGPRICLKRLAATEENAKRVFRLAEKNTSEWRRFLKGLSFKTQTLEKTLLKLKQDDVSFRDKTGAQYYLFLGNELIGGIGLVFWADKSAEIVCWLDKDYRGKGYMTEALKLAETLCFDNKKVKVVCECATANEAPQKMVVSLGYKLAFPELYAMPGEKNKTFFKTRRFFLSQKHRER